MRRTVRTVGVVLLSLLGTMSLAIASAFTTAFAYGAVALIVPGTGTRGEVHQLRPRIRPFVNAP